MVDLFEKQQISIVYVRASSIYNDSRATKEIWALLDAGYRVIVFGWNRDGAAYDECRNFFKNRDVDFNFYEVPVVALGGFKGIFKLIGFFIWVLQLLCKQHSIIEILHICNLDAGVGAAIFCWLFKKPYIYDIYDYYIDNHLVPKCLRWIVEYLEIQIINNSTVAIICTEERKEQIAKSKPKNIVVIHNSPEVLDLSMEIYTKYDVSFCGTLKGQRLLSEIISECKDNRDIKFVFAGNGRYQDLVQEISQKYDNVTFFGSVPYISVLEIERQSRVLFAVYEPTIRNHRLCAPNKFYEALALGKPIIVCRETGIDKIVEKYKLGLVIDYDAKQFFKAVRYLLAHPEECDEMGKRGRQLFLEKYDWKIMKKRLIDIYINIFGGKGRKN